MFWLRRRWLWRLVAKQFPLMPLANRGEPSVLIIAPHGSYRTMAFVQAANQLGIHSVIASSGKHSIVSDYARGIHIDLANEKQAFRELVEAASRYHFVAVIGTDDATATLAAQLSQHLNLPHNDPAAVNISRRKDLARDRLQQFNLPIPAYRCIELTHTLDRQINDVQFPVVVKPVSLAASQGVIRANNQRELKAAILRIQKILSQRHDLSEGARNTLLIEAFIPGDEVAVEAMLCNGKLELLTVFDKPEPLNGPYFEETYYITPTCLGAEQQVKLLATLQHACQAYGLKEGPVHAECRINENGIFILEVAARTIGGLCARLLRFGTGYTLEELVLSHAMGRKLQLESDTGAAGVLMIPIPKAGLFKRVEGLLAAQRVPYIEEVNIQIREGYELVPLPEGSGYFGFIFSRAPEASQAEQALREAHACLKIITAPVWKIEQGKSWVA